MSVKLFDYGNCQLETYKGTGKPPCEFDSVGDYLGYGLLKRGVKFAIANGEIAISEAIFDSLIQERSLHQHINRMAFTQDTPENEVFTDGTGLEQSVREGKTKFTTMFDCSLERAKAYHSFKGQDIWDVMYYFTEGIVITSDVSVANAKGFTVGRYDVSTIKFLAGTDKQQVSTIMQLTQPNELNDYAIFIPYSKLGFNASLKGGVIDCNIEMITPPTAGDTTCVVKVTPSGNTGTVLAGFDNILNWATGGTQATPKAAPSAISYSSSTGYYTLTFASAFAENDTLQPRLRDLTQDVAVDALGKFYAGRCALVTVAA